LHHESFVRFNLRYESSDHGETILKLVFLRLDEEGKDKGRGAALALNRLNKDSSAVIDCASDKTVSDAEMFANVFSRSILDRQVEVLEVLLTGSVRLAGDIENMSDTHINQIFSLEAGLERAHEDAIMYFN
jgi:hypothetical protein